ncbi:hypothetical protein E2542_SST04718 [Spatholobus suberectus]|nr:hypothetical protein E2542_SST04718 [Spatholobus suberectus]
MPPQQHQVQYPHVSPREESSSLVTIMDHVLDQDLPWSFMYTGLSQFQDPDLAFSKADDLVGMFDGAGFEEDIDFLFSTEPGETESDINMSAVLDGIECGDTNGGAGDAWWWITIRRRCYHLVLLHRPLQLLQFLVTMLYDLFRGC